MISLSTHAIKQTKLPTYIHYIHTLKTHLNPKHAIRIFYTSIILHRPFVLFFAFTQLFSHFFVSAHTHSHSLTLTHTQSKHILVTTAPKKKREMNTPSIPHNSIFIYHLTFFCTYSIVFFKSYVSLFIVAFAVVDFFPSKYLHYMSNELHTVQTSLF